MKSLMGKLMPGIAMIVTAGLVTGCAESPPTTSIPNPESATEATPSDAASAEDQDARDETTTTGKPAEQKPASDAAETGDKGGSDQTTDAPAAPQDATPEDQITSDQVKQEVGDALDATAKFAGQTKDEYQAAMKKKLNELDGKIADLQVKAETASRDAKEDAQRKYKEMMAELKDERQAVSKKFAQLKEASGPAWRDIASGLDAAWKDVRSTFSEAASHFQDTNTDVEADTPVEPSAAPATSSENTESEEK